MDHKQSEQLSDQLYRLHRILNRFTRAGAGRIMSQASRAGITPQQQQALLELFRENGLSLKSLSGRMGLSHSTVSGIVDRLAAKKLVYRRADENDRRISRIYLSENVKRYIKETRVGMYEPLAANIDSAPPRQRAGIVKGVGLLCDRLESVLDEK